jgi:hypothetical protein
MRRLTLIILLVPFLVPLDAGEQLDLTRFDAGVRFDLDGDGIVEQVSWPAPGA